MIFNVMRRMSNPTLSILSNFFDVNNNSQLVGAQQQQWCIRAPREMILSWCYLCLVLLSKPVGMLLNLCSILWLITSIRLLFFCDTRFLCKFALPFWHLSVSELYLNTHNRKNCCFNWVRHWWWSSWLKQLLVYI